jgi:hypothetical protein
MQRGYRERQAAEDRELRQLTLLAAWPPASLPPSRGSPAALSLRREQLAHESRGLRGESQHVHQVVKHRTLVGYRRRALPTSAGRCTVAP